MSDPPVPLPPALPATTRPAAAYARASLAPATLRAYQAGWQAFAEWCQLAGRTALPAAPETVAEHLASLATFLGRASLTKRLAAIGQYHRLANQPFSGNHPVIHHTLRGIHREHGRPARRSAALATPEIKRLVAACRTRSLADLRDRALLLLGYAGALRRAELVAIEREHVSFTPEGLRLQIPRSKTDTTGQGGRRWYGGCQRHHRLAGLRAEHLNSPTTFGEDAQGQLYVVDFAGEVFRLTPHASPDGIWI